MKVSGEIHSTQLTDLFQWIEYQRKTGSLSLVGEAIDHTVYFSQGKIAGSTPPVGTVAAGEPQIRRVLQEALDWETGSFEFVDTPLPPTVTAANLQLAISPFLDLGRGKAVAAEEPVPPTPPQETPRVSPETDPPSATDVRSIIIDRVMSGNFKIPLLPTVATKVMEITRRENYSLNDLSKVILTDQVIAANVLKQANSAFFGRGRAVTTLPMAIQRIGSDTITKLVFALSLQGIKSPQEMFLDKKKKLWTYSSACALFARFIALPVKMDHNLAFLCGLMQDFGKIVLLSVIEEVMRGASRLSDESVEKILDTYHPMVGSMVGEKWALPAPVIAAMAYHRSLGTKGEALTYAAIASLSDAIVTRLEYYTDEEISVLVADEQPTRTLAGELVFTPANKHLELNVNQLIGILTHAPECLKSAQELLNI